MLRIPFIILLITVSVAPAQGQLKEKEKAADDRSAAIEVMLAGYVESFNDRDLDGVTSAWSKDCSYLDRTTGERAEGREAIHADFKKVFAEQPDLRLSATVDRVKFVTDAVAQVEGRSIVASPDGEPAQALFSLILVRTSDAWQIHTLEESAVPTPQSPLEALKDLEWLLGIWEDRTETGVVRTTVRWSANRSFLVRSYSIEAEGETAQEGTQVIGWDPRGRQIRSWTFHSDGSFGEGVWSQSGDDWLIKSSQTLADGRAASGTYVLTRDGEDTVQLQLIGHSIAGTPQPQTVAATMTRAAEERSAGQTETAPFGVDKTPFAVDKSTP